MRLEMDRRALINLSSAMELKIFQLFCVAAENFWAGDQKKMAVLQRIQKRLTIGELKKWGASA